MLTVNNSEFMWELKYRPGTLSECILPAHDKEMFQGIVNKGLVPNLILVSSSPGTGKTTVAKALCADTDSDMFFVKGSDCRIDFVRNELTRFASSVTISGKRKVIVIDEYDSNGVAESQRYMRSFIDAYSSNCSVVITANSIDGIIGPLQSRCRVITFGEATPEDKNTMMKEMIHRSIAICKNENIEVQELKVIAALVKENFPDFRRVVNQLDQYSQKGVIDAGILSLVMNTRSPIDDVVDSLKGKDFKTLRSLAPQHVNDYANFLEKLANDLYTKLPAPSIVRMYEIIGENNQYHGLAANAEIHMTYLFIQLALELQWL
ncbi:clamp loader of DNA polymerase [Escherichia phage EcS1]|uniref:Sliding-clamp-loader large subunit n=1 Tax=Escherichia phage EcS1 TaxID=2083276 RepID=A0A2Z5ZCA6_9CAUD|nr:clamp loader of DNA polymerase [Escherichia phage EcS1]BBC78096.1 Clamp loader small subunit [Escherichia phage EcS1]